MFRGSLLANLNYIQFRIIAVLWMAVIFAMSSQATVPVPQTIWGQDKFMHFLGYAILGYFLARSFRNAHLGLTLKQVVFVALIASVYGMSDEFHQSFVVGRDASVGDWLADSLGGLAGALLLLRRKQTSIL